MINNDKWINSLPRTNLINKNESLQIDSDRWINTIHKKKNHNPVKKYTLMATFFVFGLLLVSAVKNETRNLEKEINFLKASVNLIKFDLDQAILDNQVITSPENISKLAKAHLSQDLTFYKKVQIKNLNKNYKNLEIVNNENKVSALPKNIKNQVSTKIKNKKQELEKLQKLYKDPKSIPDEVKTQVAKQIEQKKFELKTLYESPKDVITLGKIGKWSAIQVVKTFFGMPIIPGK